ncbi:hypothetical protein [Paenibacillus nasutitermitis]|uniref:Uncharacterized protein n=1 Tax=Paenibacillus nasutitermitis TaxID=1652958 RepID=A0A916ZCG7_9BACL|nr:hypothetical protein [Paenibacillus nasutitermitis]GGD88371.1 hypothetical protein GCM10010911_53610 [Paenibacillus nasutitermitis]
MGKKLMRLPKIRLRAKMTSLLVLAGTVMLAIKAAKIGITIIHK